MHRAATLPILVAALAVPALAGCLVPAAPDAGLAQPGPAGGGAPGASRVVRFDTHGTLLPLDPAWGAGASVRLLPTGFSGWRGEPMVAVQRDGTLFTTAWDSVIRSRDDGQTWAQVWRTGILDVPDVPPLVEGGPLPGGGDPVLWVDEATQRVYANYLSMACTVLAWSDDGGATWRENRAACVLPVVDFQKLATGPPGPGANPLAGLLAERVLYLCYNRVAAMNCLVSHDGGTTFVERVVTLGRGMPCGGVPGDPAVAPDGTVVVPQSFGCHRLVVSVSRDSGLTWTTHLGPDEAGGEGLAAQAAFTPDGTLYALWQGQDHLKYLARSLDLGASWDGPWRVSPPEVRSTEFMALAAGDDGRLAMAFLGTRDTNATGEDVPTDARWHLWLVATSDAHQPGPTFTAWQATPDDDPVHVGCARFVFNATEDLVRTGDIDCGAVGDYLDIALGPDGRAWAAFADGCTEGCAGNPDATPEDSKDAHTTLAVLDGLPLRHGGAR